jgi:hypothetical protein
MKLTTTRTLIVTGAVLALGIGGGVAIADIPSSTDGKITACMLKPGNTIRLIDAQAGAVCKKSETKVEWNQQGVPGNDGSDGVSGFERVSDIDTQDITGDNTTQVSRVVACPVGKVATGGGGSGSVTLLGGGSLTLDLVSTDPFSDRAWSITLKKEGGSLFVAGEVVHFAVFANCITALP